jgi:hypothetical protein
VALAAVALSAAGCSIGGGSGTTTVTVTRTVTVTQTVTSASGAPASCQANQVTGDFSLAPGSEGAGQVAYTLTLRNTSQAPCSLTVKKLILADASGAPLPTRAFGATPNGLLAPGASASAKARFSPDVPSKGDSQSGSCQPKAYALTVEMSDGFPVNAPVKPPTSVCGQGTLTFPSN